MFFQALCNATATRESFVFLFHSYNFFREPLKKKKLRVSGIMAYECKTLSFVQVLKGHCPNNLKIDTCASPNKHVGRNFPSKLTDMLLFLIRPCRWENFLKRIKRAAQGK
jgi:hypothetical protein